MALSGSGVDAEDNSNSAKTAKPQLQATVLAAGLRERFAESAEDSANSSNSESLLAVINWHLTPDKNRFMSSVSQTTDAAHFAPLRRAFFVYHALLPNAFKFRFFVLI